MGLKRTIKVLTWVKIVHDTEWEEYQVVPRFGTYESKVNETYHTDDVSDALGTAELMDRAYAGRAD